MPSTTKTQRFLDLIAYLAGRRMPVAVEEIMEKVPPYAAQWVEGDERARAAVRRKFERDKDELRALGIPIETVDYSINFGVEQVQGYRLDSRDFYLPYLRLVSGSAGAGRTGVGPGEAEDAAADDTSGEGDASRPPGGRGARRPGGPAASPGPPFEIREDEARAAMDALDRVAELPSFPFRREARSALRKLTYDLPPDLVREERPGSAVRYLPPPGGEDLRDRLRTLSDALLRRKEVAFGYYGIYRDALSDRRVWPYGLLFQHSHWYLVGHDLDRDDLRCFRVGRMDAPSMNPRKPGTPDYRIPDDWSLEDWAGRPSWALAGQDEEPLEVAVRFDFPRSLWAERNGHGELAEELEDGAQLRTFRVQDPAPFLRWLLPLEGDARIESPPELDDELVAIAREVAAMHRGPAADPSAGPAPDPSSGEGADG